MYTVAPLTDLTGRLFSFSTETGVPLRPTLYSVEPIFAVPEGRITLCALTALTTSVEERHLAISCCVSVSTMICRTFPP